MSNQSKTTGSKAPMKDRVTEKTMPLTKWFIEQYYQTYEACSKDPRYKQLPPFNQTSMLATVFIATNAALDKNRDAKQVAKRLEELSQSEKINKVA
tara:strand:- start:725 stop:1012 length:288 start_codon:yes stop_codon:yes gene_type:complete